MQVDESFDIEAPRRDVFAMLTSPAHFPDFMTGVESVFAETKERSRWRVSMAGVPETFYAVITDYAEDERITWTSVDATTMEWSARLDDVDERTTRLTVRVRWSPRGDVSLDAPELDELSVRCDLQRFRMLAERLTAAAA